MNRGGTPVPRTTAAALVRAYDAILLDSYGVLVDAGGALPHAVRFVQHLLDVGKPFLVLSNDASRTTATSAVRYHRLGLPLDPPRIVTSGSLIAPHFEAHDRVGSRCVVLGPTDSVALVRDAGGVVVSADDPAFETLVVCDDEGYPWPETLETVISTLYARLDAGHTPALILPNPDLVFPRGPGRVGLTAGSVAGVIERALTLRYGDEAPQFAALGKPHAPMFEAAQERLGWSAGARMVMVGDQLVTDIAGACDYGIDAVLIGTGLTDLNRIPGFLDRRGAPRPTWLLPNLAL
jgi:HAD superfamily hydrolase (TIGR01450 family)